MKTIASVITLLGFLNAAQFAGAATRTVTNTADSGAGSLRDTIAASAAGDTVNFSAGLTGMITLTTGELVIGRSLTVIGPGAKSLTISGNYASRVFSIAAGTVNISGLSVINGYGNYGGGIINNDTLTLNDCNVSGNSTLGIGGSALAGGIANYGTLALNGCTLSGNSTSAANGLANGGGLVNSGTATANNCTFSGNVVQAGASSNGGGGGGIDNGGTLTLNNCTVSGNSVSASSASGVASGGGIANYGATLTLSNCTVSANSSFSAGGSVRSGGIYSSGGTAQIENTIIAGNTAVTGPDVYGIFSSQGFNFVGKTNASSGWLTSDLIGSVAAPFNPLLGPLQDNGGSTFTMALLPGSAAIDVGRSGGAATDQRGAPRPNDNPAILNASGGDGSDIGAYEIALNLTVTVVGGGVVLKHPDQLGYAYIQTVKLRAIPASGWTLNNWSGDDSGANNPLSLVMVSDKSITANFTATATACAPAPLGLVSWWPGAGNASDLIGDKNGTPQNGVTFAAGKVGKAFSFDGLDDYVDLGNSSSLNFVNHSFSVEAWIYLTQAADGFNLDGIVSRYGHTTTGSASWILGRAPSGHLWFALDSNGLWSPERIVASTNITSLNQWHHVAGVYDHSTGLMRLYVDGLLNNSGSGSPITVYASTAKTTIGAWFYYNGAEGAQAIPGLVDEVALYNRAITNSEIAALYNAGSAGKCLTPLYITSVSKSGNNVNLSWLAQKGITYRAQSKTNLNAGTSWTDVSGNVTATGATASKTDVVPANAPQRVYRVELLE